MCSDGVLFLPRSYFAVPLPRTSGLLVAINHTCANVTNTTRSGDILSLILWWAKLPGSTHFYDIGDLCTLGWWGTLTLVASQLINFSLSQVKVGKKFIIFKLTGYRELFPTLLCMWVHVLLYLVDSEKNDCEGGRSLTAHTDPHSMSLYQHGTWSPKITTPLDCMPWQHFLCGKNEIVSNWVVSLSLPALSLTSPPPPPHTHTHTHMQPSSQCSGAISIDNSYSAIFITMATVFMLPWQH